MNAATIACLFTALAADPSVTVRQLTHGPAHHFFGYIGQCQTIPWNASGRYIVALQTDFHDHMPRPDEAANIILIDTEKLDTHHDNAIRVVDRTRAWNFQQGTMLFWNPTAAETEFFFNDRDPETNQIFCVRFDISRGEHGERVAAYKYPDTPIGNSGVAQRGGYFLGLNYGRLARLRPVTGYPEAFDWTAAESVQAPSDDGIFLVNIATKERRLLLSFHDMAAKLREKHPNVEGKELFINHTLWDREDDRIFFYVRGDFETPNRFDVPMVMHADGSNLTVLERHLGGHPEWAPDHRVIGTLDGDAILFDVDKQQRVATLGNATIFPDPNGDKSLSPAGDWLVNGYRTKSVNYYAFLRLANGAHATSPGFDQRTWTKGELRIDPAPCWNRDGTKILFPSLDASGATRQLFVAELHP